MSTERRAKSDAYELINKTGNKMMQQRWQSIRVILIVKQIKLEGVNKNATSR